MAWALRKGGTVFTFLPIVPEGATGPMIKFLAFINNISDSNSGTWSENMDMGRADPKVMYQSYARTINVEFYTVALSAGDENFWAESLNSLSELTKPTYKKGKGFNGVFCNMVIGTLINEIGIVTNVDFTFDNETPWINDMPIYINCSVGFKVVGFEKPDYKKSSGGLGTGNFKLGRAK